MMSDINEFTCTGCKLSTWSMYDLSGKSHIACPQGGGRWQPTIKDGDISGYTVTVHVSPDCSRDTLEALGEMMKHLIEHVEKVHVPIGRASDERR